MSDTKKQVKDAAIGAMTGACDVIGNRDMEHMTGDIVKAIVNNGAVPEIMHNLAGVTFVQVINQLLCIVLLLAIPADAAYQRSITS
jgi:elongation factor 3